MSHEVAEAAADAGMHAERSALIQAAQRGGVTLWYSQEDEVYIAVFPSEPTIRGIGDTPALFAALIFFGLIAPALMKRGGQMRQRVRGAEFGAGAWFGVVKIGIRVEWRVQA